MLFRSSMEILHDLDSKALAYKGSNELSFCFLEMKGFK